MRLWCNGSNCQEPQGANLQMKRMRATAVVIAGMWLCASIHAQQGPESLRSKIIEKKGDIRIWSKSASKMTSLSDASEIVSDKTVILDSGAMLNLTFEPFIEMHLKEKTSLGFSKLLIDRASRVIRIFCTLDKGEITVKAPPQAGHTLLFTLQTPSAIIDLSAAEMVVSAAENGTTSADVIHGAAKILPRESTLKTLLNAGSRGVVDPARQEVRLSAIEKDGVKKRAQSAKQPSIAVLSIKSTDKAKGNVEHISNALAKEFENTTSARVLFLDDLKRLLHAEGDDRLLDCFTDSCISRIGARAGVDIVIVGNLGQLGSAHILDLKMVDVLRDKLLSRASVSVSEDLGLILGELPTAIRTLVKEDTTLSSVVSKPRRAVASGAQNEPYREKLVWIFPGSFSMGSISKTGDVDELPSHRVELDGFFIDRFEVTRDEFEKVMGFNPSSAKGCGDCPATEITWQEASDYCSKQGKRLPTEAEWEYACRAGTTTQFYTGVTISADQANFYAQKPYGGSQVGVFRAKSLPVGSFEPNPWNLHDMYGNAAEWCADWYDVAYYGNTDKRNPAGPKSGKLRVVRGGSWNSDGNGLRSSNRFAFNPELRLNTIGFRCVKSDSSAAPGK